jgi:Tfp pilus assembly protein PilV
MKMLVKSELQNARPLYERCPKLQIEKYAVGAGLPVRFPQPPAPSPQPPRRGISLTEVLIAMGILTLGLLGVAAVFPVGSWYMQKASISDQGSAIAQSVMNDVVARGMLNPGSWYVMIPNPRAPSFGNWNTGFQCDGKYCPPQSPINLTFTRPFAAALGEAVNQPNALSDPTLINKQMGGAFVIDPIGVAAFAMPDGVGLGNVFAYPFPSSMRQVSGTTSANLYGAAWQSWGNSTANTWPIRRATIQQANGWQMSPALASAMCSGTDDLAYDLPERDDRPAIQNWDATNVAGNQVPLARQWTGDFSWMVTVLPPTNAARNGMVMNPEGFDYQVSVVVFHKRALPTAFPASNAEANRNSALERGVKATVLSSGLNGGELLLEKLNNDQITESPFSQLKTGNWIMLCGPHPNSSDAAPRFVLNWYQVLSIEGKDEGELQRLVTVRGPQWPWEPPGPTAPNDHLSKNLCVAICKGVVAVHTKSLRLENPRGGAFGSGMSLVTPPGGTDPKYTY